MKFRFSKRSHAALTIWEVMIVLAILAIFALVLIPAISRPRMRSSRVGCINHLKQLDIAFRGFAIDLSPTAALFPMQVSITNGGTMELVASGKVYPHFLVMSNEINNPRILVCPEDKTRTPASSFTNLSNTNISYFVGVDATDTLPNTILSGDDHLSIGGKQRKSGLLEIWTNAPVAWTSARHSGHGNVLLADGSVQAVVSKSLHQILAATGQATNRLVMP